MPAIIPFIPLIAAGVSAAGGYLSNRNKSKTSPTLDPKFGPLQDMVLRQMRQRLGQDPDLTGYSATGQQNINKAFDTIAQSQSNNLTARGLSTSPVAGAVDATRQNARGGSLASFLNTLPMLRRQMQSQDMGMATDLLGMGRGSETTGQSGGGAAGSAESLAQYLGYMTASGALRRPQAPPYGTTYAGPFDTRGMG